MARPKASELMARVRIQQDLGRAEDQEVPAAVTSLPPRETPVVSAVKTPAVEESAPVVASIPDPITTETPTAIPAPAPPVSAVPSEPTQPRDEVRELPAQPLRRTPTPVASAPTTRRGSSGVAAVTVVSDFVDPRGWIPIAPGKEGFTKKAPMVNADLVDVLETRKAQVQRATRRKVSWDQVMALAADQLPKPREFVRELEARRGSLGLDDPAVPRRRVTGMVSYATADQIEDLAKEAEQQMGRRVAMEDVWAVAFSLVLDAINRATQD